MRYEKVKVTRDPHTTYLREIPEWETPILELLFEEGNVVRTGEFVDVTAQYAGKSLKTNDGDRATHDDRGYPLQAAAEYDRLARAYGTDPQSGIPHVSAVYGQSGAGIRALGRAIEDAKLAEIEAEPAKPVKEKRSSARKSAVAADNLLG